MQEYEADRPLIDSSSGRLSHTWQISWYFVKKKKKSMNHKGSGEKAVSTQLSGCKTAGRFIYFSCYLVFHSGGNCSDISHWTDTAVNRTLHFHHCIFSHWLLKEGCSHWWRFAVTRSLSFSVRVAIWGDMSIRTIADITKLGSSLHKNSDMMCRLPLRELACSPPPDTL